MVGTTYPFIPIAQPATLPAGRPRPVQARSGDWKYSTLRRERSVVALAVLFSIGFHVVLLLGFNRRPAPARVTHGTDEAIIQMVLPEIPEEEKEKPVEALNDESNEAPPGVSVPMLADQPTLVPVDAFVQPLDFRPKIDTDLSTAGLKSIPVNIARAGAGGAKLGKVFEIGDLDREPKPIVQPPPRFPRELVKIYDSSVVQLEFIITSKGEVVNPSAISSADRRFEDAAIEGVQKWKFRPGLKGGRPVNTRVRIAINFRVTKED